MTDLTFCYIHMTQQDLDILDTIGTSDYITGDLSDSDVDVPSHMKPPNPDDSDVLPSQVHPSYPYGNPASIKHPAARPRRPYDPSSRALFEDMGYAGGGVNGALRWKELALDQLLPVDVEKEEAAKAALARKLANGNGTANHPPPIPQPPAAMLPPGVNNEEDDDENEENDEDDEEEEEEETSSDEEDYEEPEDQ
ncbi:hypothetical protein EUX98_g6438 [Antrodiella citrinella]|uniref:Uncharacterized protein n=1 Tax=Antrodiella citrinella TaxID=2447956 RepID=A0A4S4MRK2_9APHY|nr:hypothetical protein EUX98_g6438 [Antrodiella citrinella]